MPNRKLTDEEFKEYCLRSNKNTGSFDFDLLANFDEKLLLDVGFDSEELLKINTNELLEEVEQDIKPIQKIHVLLSFPVDKFVEIKPYIEEILKIGMVEYEQSGN